MLSLSPAITALKNGQIIAYPTEAVYALGCDPQSEHAVLKLLQLKKRPISKGVILIASHIIFIQDYIHMSSVPIERMQYILAKWPGPFTWVFPASPKVPTWIRGNHHTVAVRVTAHPLAKALCHAFNSALVSSSANLQAKPPMICAAEVKAVFGAQGVLVVPGKVGHLARPTIITDAMSGLVIRS